MPGNSVIGQKTAPAKIEKHPRGSCDVMRNEKNYPGEIKIIDTTLRDGEQQAGIVFSVEDKLRIAQYLDSLNIYQIEAGVPAMGGEEKESVRQIAALGLKSKISAWNRLNLKDIQHSMDCGVAVIHISVPASDLQIAHKLKKSREWVKARLEQCIQFAHNESYEVTVGFEDATRADLDFLLQLCAVCREKGVKAVRYADTLGIAVPSKIYETVRALKEFSGLEIGIHAHNDLGMALANSVAALAAGATFVDCTLNGIGERAGNCDYYKFAKLLEYRILNRGELLG